MKKLLNNENTLLSGKMEMMIVKITNSLTHEELIRLMDTKMELMINFVQNNLDKLGELKIDYSESHEIITKLIEKGSYRDEDIQLLISLIRYSSETNLKDLKKKVTRMLRLF